MAEVVKIDSELMNQIEKLVRENKFVYSSKKQVVNLAIIEFLKSKAVDTKKGSLK